MSFANSFWSRDYHNGLSMLFSKLEQGCVENNEVLALAQARAEIEDSYGQKLRDIDVNFAPKKNGFDRDDGASMRQAYVGIIQEMSKEGQHHIQVANNIRNMVLEPFGSWADEHAQRVEYSKQITHNKVKEFERSLNEVNKAQKRYFNKCRLLEEMKEKEEEEEEDAEDQDDSSEQGTPEAESSEPPTGSSVSSTANNGPLEVSPTSQELTLNGTLYTDKEVQDLITRMLKEIPKRDYRVPILGTYSNTSSGAEIVQWVQLHMAGDMQQVERIGQELVDNGILRLVGQVGSKFANSSVMMYQWRPRAFELAGISFSGGALDTIMGSSIGESITERWQDYYRANDNPEQRLSKEVKDLDQKYRKSVVILDNNRCQLEELLFDHFNFMQKCETDRLKALKAVALDLVASQSNVVPSIQASVDKQLLYQESMNPATDLRFLIESYRSGPRIPQVTIYDNYYSSSDGTIFGMDLELRARGDGKPVPYIVSTILGHLDKTYPRMENDEARLKCWWQLAPLVEINNLRRDLNLDVSFDRGILEKHSPQIVVSVLLTYLFQLPDSVLPSQHYDILKAIYSKPQSESRLQALQNTLAQFRLPNIATLDVLTAHVNRLVSIAKADNEILAKICKNIALHLLRPQEYTPHTINDSFGTQIVMDLVQNREIFKELRKIAQPRRENSVGSQKSVRSRKESRKESRKASISNRESVEARVSRIASSASRVSSSSSRKDSHASKVGSPLTESQANNSDTSDTTAPVSNERTSAVSSPEAVEPKKDLSAQLDELASEAEEFRDASDSLQ